MSIESPTFWGAQAASLRYPEIQTSRNNKKI
jgi:hypothetical protein